MVGGDAGAPGGGHGGARGPGGEAAPPGATNTSPWRHVRYVPPGGSGGSLLSRPGRLYWAELRAGAVAQAAVLYDSTGFPQRPLVALEAPAGGASAPFPPVPFVTVPFERGLYVSFSATAFTGGLSVGWDRQ